MSAVTVSFLLTFTALDLRSDFSVDPSCALDRSADSAASTVPPPAGSGDASSAIHHDDCFCCSHCVRPAVFFTIAQLVTFTPFAHDRPWIAFWPAVDEPFRPPRLS